ncbi:MAG: hypothetical protein U9R16_00525 [Campylobacterota bacterium]|nr:hypothetical protein [Campylobacterota bacterium]
MSDRKTEIIEEEIIESEEVLSNIRDEVFEDIKLALIDEKRLLGRFIDFCDEYNNFEYDEMGENMEEATAVLNRCDKIRNKFLANIEEKLLCVFENVETNTLTNMISCNVDTKENQFKVVIEVMDNSFNLEVI